MANDHDSGYKFLFSTPELVRDLILGFVPDEWLHRLDYRTLEIVPGSYITEDLKARADDIVWRVRVGGEWVYLYLLIEFQSTIDSLHRKASAPCSTCWTTGWSTGPTCVGCSPSGFARR